MPPGGQPAGNAARPLATKLWEIPEYKERYRRPNATVAHAGVAGGSVQGLYQVNAMVPANAASGNQPVVVTIGVVASQSGVTVNVQ